MVLNSEEILKNSFVVTIDEARYKAFVEAFALMGIPSDLLPKKFIGYEISEEYLLSNFKILSDLKNYPKRGYLEKNLNLIHSLCNNASHFAIVQHAMLLNLPFVTIFEDDAVPEPNCIEKLDKYCSDVPDSIDVLRLGHSFNPLREQPAQDLLSSFEQSENLIIGNFYGSHAYVVFKKYYKRFLEDNKNQPRCDYQKINPTQDKVVYALKESLFRQQNVLGRPVIHSYKLPDGRIKLPIVS